MAFPGLLLLYVDVVVDIVLENLTAGYKHPCIIDLKMGRRSWDEEVHDELEISWRKIRANATTSSDLGFRLGGLRVLFLTNRYRFRVSYILFHSRVLNSQSLGLSAVG